MNEEEKKDLGIVKEWFGKRAEIAYRLFWDQEDSTVYKFTVWDDGSVSFNDQPESYSINFGLFADGKEETLQEWIDDFNKDVESEAGAMNLV